MVEKPVAAMLTRRDLLAATAASALVGPAGIHAAQAQQNARFAGKNVVFASWGGVYQDAQKVGYCDSFAAKTGAKVIQDGPVSYAKLRTMVEGGSPTWDVVDVTIDFLYGASKDGLFEKIDTSIVDISRVEPKFVHEFGIGCIVWSYVLTYSTTQFTSANHPASWADAFDLKKFPGRRMFRNRVNPMLEVALLADGVPADKLYPLDVDRAFKKLDTIKQQTIWWETNSQSQQLMVDGEAVIGIQTHSRAFDSIGKGAKLAVEWNGNMQSVDYLVVPRGSKVRDAAMGLINEMTLPDAQARVANLVAIAPTNPAAFPLIDEKVKPWMSTSPDNAKKGFVINEEYWRDNFKQLTERWEGWRLG